MHNNMAKGPEIERAENLSGREQLKRFLSGGNRDVRVEIINRILLQDCMIDLQSELKLSDKGNIALDLLSELALKVRVKRPADMQEGEFERINDRAINIVKKYQSEEANRLRASGKTVFFNNVGPETSWEIFNDMENINAELEAKK